MTQRIRELVVVGILLALIAAGVVFEALASGVDESDPAPTGGRIRARALFCPPTSADAGSILRVSAAADSEEGVAIGVEPVTPQPEEVEGGTSIVRKIAGGAASDVIGYGHAASAGGFVDAAGPVEGASAAPCSRAAATEWFFAAGSAALENDERILLYNPFPDEAVMRLSLYTPRGLETKTSLQEVAVPAQSTVDVALNEAIRVRRTVGVRVVAKRGRVVAWREMFTQRGDQPRSAQLSLGAAETSETWYFADGGIGPGVDERISLLNPEGREAVVSITVATSQETLQPRKLLEYAVPRRSAVSVALEDFLEEPEVFSGASVAVKSLNGVGIAAERTVYYDTSTVSGGASEVGAPAPAPAWLLPAAAADPEDDAVALMNPTSETITVNLTLLGTSSSRSPEGLQRIEIQPGSRRKVRVQEFAGAPAAVLATADGPIVGERYAYSPRRADVAVVSGIPLGE